MGKSKKAAPARRYVAPAAVAIAAFVLGYGLWRLLHRVDIAEFIRASGEQRYNVLLITIDTIRADRLHCYGFNEISTPNIDRLAGSGVRFADATTHVPLTLPAHTSIHTSNFPSYHGVHDNGGFYVPKSQITMAQIFKQNGFATAAFVAAYVLDSIWGLDKGFDTYYDNFELTKEDKKNMGNIQRNGGEVADKAIQWLDEHRSERFFLWTHFYDPHTPYEPPKEFADQYPDKPYIGEIAYTDSVVGRLLDYLDTHGLRDRTVVLLTGDHGESLGEHRESTHAFFIYDSTIHVPMILSAPQRELQGQTVLKQVRNVDIMPTLLQLAGLPVPESIQGRSLLHSIFDYGNSAAAPSYAECYFPQYHFGWSRLLSVRNGEYKFIDAPRPEIYDLKKDPEEEHNVYEQHKDLADRMKAELREIEKQTTEGATMQPGAMDSEAQEKLAALGYIGAFGGPVEADYTKLPDPKDKVELMNLIGNARMDAVQNEHEKAVEKFQRALQEDPNIVDAHFMLGNEYFKLERYEDALEAFKKTLELKPDYEFAVINLANTYRAMGRVDDAITGLKFFLEKNPDNTQALHRMGELYLEKNEPDIAMEYLRKALESEPDTSWVYNSIGAAYLQKKDQKKAEESFRKALELNPDINMAHFNLAQLYESQERWKEAEDEYLAEIRISPKNFKAHFNLGRMYVGAGKLEEGIQHLNAVIEDAPDFPLGYLYLAQAYVEKGMDLDRAIELANKGLELKPEEEYRPLGHYILADVYNRKGRPDLEKEQLALARRVGG